MIYYKTGIQLSFLTAVLSILISCNNKGNVFEKLPATKTHITFQNNLPERKGFNILYYLYYYQGGGVATGDINNDGLPDIYFTANTKGNNKLYLNKGNFEFEDITAKAGVAGSSEWCSGVTMADVNADGWLDIYVSAISKKLGLQGHNELFINNGNGTFSEESAKYGLDLACYTVQAAFFDYDRDGDLDCYILNQSDRPFQNIVDTSNRKKYDSLSGDRFLRNDLNTPVKKFTDISVKAGIFQSNLGYGLGLAVADLNNDGWDDVYVGNDFHENDYYYVNNGNGTFTESGAKHFRHYSRFSMGNDVADYNNDGQLDIITADMLPDNEKILKTYGSDENPDIYNFKIIRNGFQHQYSKNCLQTNNGNGSSFSETALLSGVSATDWSWAPLFADFDNDGNKDLFISSGIVKRPVDMDFVQYISNIYMKASQEGMSKYDDEALEKMPGGSSHSYLFKGDGNLFFKNVSADWGINNKEGFFTGASYADLDNDGDLDLVINAINESALILKNNSPKKNFISVSFKSDTGNTFGIGGKAYLFQKDKPDSYRLQYQQLMLTRGFQSSSETRLHFGLDSTEVIDSILVVWPDQKYQVLKNVKANQFLTINQKDASGVFEYNNFFPLVPPILQQENIAVDWKHKENDFTDFNVQYLIPHSQSTRGPKLAVADINGDGLDDFYVCGARGQAGALMMQQKNGSFTAANTSIFSADAASEDVDATFFDANGDTFLDLYVVSGGNQLTGKDSALLDRLYLNDGKGKFTKSTSSLPPIFENKSCVAVADIDKDGDQDIFIGNLANSRAYGVPQTSYVLQNNGKAVFSIAGQDVINLGSIGIVTTASFTDIDNNGWLDLIVAGEWMPITIFKNSNGKFAKSAIPHSTGWWQTLFIDDVNKDGHMDILAGNWGWNNKFWSGKDGPVKLYVADFDGNGRVDQLISYTLNGKEYPFLAKDEVEKALPLLKKHYLHYADYAGEVMKDVFYGWIDTIQPSITERLGSAVCFGNGKGGFNIQDLPASLQLAPIFSFQKAGVNGRSENLYLSGGNFFDVIPYEGRYDAQPVSLFSSNNNNHISFLQQQNLSELDYQVRDIKRLRTARGELFAVAPNNAPLLFFRKTKE